MIALLVGVVDTHDRIGGIVLVGGVGYEVAWTPWSYDSLGMERRASAKVRLWIHEVISESSHQLFGFADTGELQVFRELIKLKRMGPKTAIRVLGACKGPLDFVERARTATLKDLCRLDGLGKVGAGLVAAKWGNPNAPEDKKAAAAAKRSSLGKSPF